MSIQDESVGVPATDNGLSGGLPVGGRRGHRLLPHRQDVQDPYSISSLHHEENG